MRIRHLILKYSFVWNHKRWCLVGSKSFNTLSTCFLRFEFTDYSNRLTLLYSSHYRAQFCFRRISSCLIINIIPPTSPKNLSDTTINHSVKSVRIRSYSGPHFSRVFPHSDWIRRDTPYLYVFRPNAGKCQKNVDRNNSEYRHFFHYFV